MWLHSLKVAQLLRSAACLHTNQSRSYLNHLVVGINTVQLIYYVEHAQNYVLYVMNIHCVTYYSNGCQDSAVWITNFGS